MFSEREDKIIKIIGKKTLSFGEITQQLFKDGIPMDANIKVNNCIRRIVTKCDFYDVDWTLTKSSKNRRIVVTREKR